MFHFSLVSCLFVGISVKTDRTNTSLFESYFPSYTNYIILIVAKPTSYTSKKLDFVLGNHAVCRKDSVEVKNKSCGFFYEIR